MLLRGLVALALFVALLMQPPAAQAEPRIALLIGNQGYTGEIGRLVNPHNDLALLEKTLKGLKFEVRPVRDAGLAAMHREINAYARRVREAGADAVAFFYYAGHGAADASKNNYLIPVDAKSAEDGELWDQSLRLSEIARILKADAGNATHFMVIDACRNELKLKAPGTRAPTSARGLARTAQEKGMLIAYATAEGELASDSGTYSAALAEEIVKPGIEAVTMFRNVQRRVRALIKQEPYLGFDAIGDVYFGGTAAGVVKPDLQLPPPPPPPGASGAEMARICREVEGTSNAGMLGMLASRHKGTPAADCIEARLAQLRQADAVASTKAKAEADERARLEAERRRQQALAEQAEEARRKAEEAAARAEVAMKRVCTTVRATSDLATLKAAAEQYSGTRAAACIAARLDELKVTPLSQTRTAAPLTASEERGLKAKDSFKECDACPEMVVVPAGSFMMGFRAQNFMVPEGREDPRPVTIARPLAVGRFEVTFAEWDACVAAGGCSHRPSDNGWGRDKRPVINVSRDDVTRQYLPWLRRHTGKDYRLLTEAEWEYVARAGSTTPFWWGSSISVDEAYKGYNEVVESFGKERAQTAPVDSSQPNPWGIHNARGNVWEWVQDCWNATYSGAPSDGSAWTSGDCGQGLVRGISWLAGPMFIDVRTRHKLSPDGRDLDIGFRIGRVITP